MGQEPSFLSALSGLIFVLGIIFLISYLFKRFGAKFISGMPHTTKKAEINILDIRVIDPKNRLVLFHCRDKDYLILTGETNCVVDSFAAQEQTKKDPADV